MYEHTSKSNRQALFRIDAFGTTLLHHYPDGYRDNGARQYWGLSLSYDIIKAHRGEVKVETNKGEGTEFIIQLPIV